MCVTKGSCVLFLSAIVVSLTLTAGVNLACICGVSDSGKTMRDVAASHSEASANRVIFQGVVEGQELKTGPIGPPANTMSVTMAGTHRAVHLRVLHAYRGLGSEEVTVLTGIGLGDCGFDFETGKEYLVYAEKIDANNLFTSICTGTSLSEHAGAAIRFLRGEKPTAADLLDVQSYYAKFLPQWTGTACGRIMVGGSPLDKASVTMTQVRDEPFPPLQAADENGSETDGSFCIRDISPGKYILTADRDDYDAHSRWMAYYPGVRKRSEAVPIEIHAGDNVSDLKFSVVRETLYTVKFRIVTPDGSPLPLDSLGVSVDSPDNDALSYHLEQNRNEDGIFYAGYVPPCYCMVRTYIQSDSETGKVPAELSKWQMAEEEVIIPAKEEVLLLKLKPLN